MGQLSEYEGLMDMIDGGGAGQVGDEFEGGGMLSMLANVFADPYGSYARREAAEQQPRVSTRAPTPPVYSGRGNYGMPTPPMPDGTPQDQLMMAQPITGQYSGRGKSPGADPSGRVLMSEELPPIQPSVLTKELLERLKANGMTDTDVSRLIANGKIVVE